MEKEQQKPFRVIVVGGGLVGLTAAHVLSKADIDFVILEHHNNLTPWIGSLLVMWPATYRIFNQLGIQDVMLPILDNLDEYETISAGDGSFLHRLTGAGNMWSRKYVNLPGVKAHLGVCCFGWRRSRLLYNLNSTPC
jgi:2-polyprenyl-6-methoxyphenol hydroxylase-like FAD-dependent oxidoreductase